MDPLTSVEEKLLRALTSLQSSGKHDVFIKKAKDASVFTRIKILKEFIAQGNDVAFDLLLPCIDPGSLKTLSAL